MRVPQASFQEQSEELLTQYILRRAEKKEEEGATDTLRALAIVHDVTLRELCMCLRSTVAALLEPDNVTPCPRTPSIGMGLCRF